MTQIEHGKHIIEDCEMVTHHTPLQLELPLGLR